jgi:anti-sigma factor RsiW
MTMDCKLFKKRLHRYVDRALPPLVHAVMEAHAASCPACRREVESLTDLATVLHAADSTLPVPEGFARRVMARAVVRKVPARFSVFGWLSSQDWWTEIASPTRAAVAVVLVIGLSLGAVMGWDVNRNGRNALPPSGKSDALAAYNLDYLGDAPAGSLAQVVMALDR